MPLVSPQEIATKAENAYPRFLKQWIRGGEEDGFPPLCLRVNLKADTQDIPGTIAANEKLKSQSKAVLKWGYTVTYEQVRSRGFGNNPFPKKITIETLDDLLRLAKKGEEFAATCRVAQRVRAEFPQLEDWLVKHVRTLHQHATAIEGLIEVAQYFLEHPWPDCYARQIPVAVDTKFIGNHRPVLRQWLDLLLPASAIDVNESAFARRFGLRDGQLHRSIRLLDPQLQQELGLPFEELSLPLRTLADLPVQSATILVVENDLNLLTLPLMTRGLGIRGVGDSVTRLEGLCWLENNRVLYWGDIDVEGLLILSRLRNLFPHVESIMMDRVTLDCLEKHHGKGNNNTPSAPTNLTPGEMAAFEVCLQENCRLEQEKIPQAFVDQVIAAVSE